MGLDVSKDVNPNAHRGYLLEKFTRHRGGVNCLALDEGRALMATGGEDRTLVLWKLGRPTQSRATLSGHPEYVSCCALHPDRPWLLSGSSDGSVRKWCLDGHACLFTYEGHEDRVNRIVCAGDVFVSTSVDRTARAWRTDVHQYEAAEDACIRRFEGHSKAVYPVVLMPEDESPLDGKCFSDKDVLITGSSDKTVRIWSLRTAKATHVLKGHTGTVNALVVDPEGRLLFSGGGDGVVRCWDLATGQCTRQMIGHEGAVLQLVGHNKMLYSCSVDMTARAWIMEYGECIKVYRGHTHSVSCIAYKDGYLFTGCADTNGRMFKAKSGECKRVFKGHTKAVVQIEVGYDKLYTVSVDGTLRVWDTTGILDDECEPPEEQPVEVLTQ